MLTAVRSGILAVVLHLLVLYFNFFNFVYSVMKHYAVLSFVIFVTLV